LYFGFHDYGSNHKSFRYSLRLRIAIVDGMRNMYYDYAHKKAEVVTELRQELFGEVVDIVSDETMGHECNA
jgi:hypothetical protein